MAAVLMAVSANTLYAEECAPWKTAETHLRTNWGKKYAGETVLKIVADGSPSTYEKMESTGKEKIGNDGNRYEYFEKVIYCRVPAKVTVRRANGNQTVFDVSAIYKVKGNSFQFDNIGVSGNSEVAGEGQEAPSKDVIKKAIADQWKAENPGHTVDKVAVTDPELKKDSSENRWWYNAGADIFITDENGTKKKCVNDYTTIYI